MSDRPQPPVEADVPSARPHLLACPSPQAWLDRALGDLDTLLLDHAHCEKKAASTVLGFVFRSPEIDSAGALSRMAREELGHFELALRELRRRNLPFGRLEPSRYAGELTRGIRKKVESEAMLDALVVAALIEERSHERIAILAGAVPDPHLATFYRGLLPAEERHAGLMLEIAARFGDPSERLPKFSAIEAELIATGEENVRMHG